MPGLPPALLPPTLAILLRAMPTSALQIVEVCDGQVGCSSNGVGGFDRTQNQEVGNKHSTHKPVPYQPYSNPIFCR